VCPGQALRLVGTYYPVKDLVEILLQDSLLYRYSEGGVTLSGGECALYANYVGRLAKALKTESIHVTIETSGFFEYGRFAEQILPHVDLVYYDLKIADAAGHKLRTGRRNGRILGNFRRLMTERPESVHPRIPLIPTITTTKENLSAIVRFLKECGAAKVSLLPYNPCGLEKYPRLGKPAPPLPRSFMAPEDEEAIFSMFGKLISEVTEDLPP
jgi:pyruvate formate lyase activating enzyme